MSEEEFVKQRLGTSLRGKWTLDRVLGVGGMAAVYVGVHKIGREDAIKILHPEVARSANVRARFEQEARAANRLKHPGVVEIRDVDTSEDGAPFMVMELLSGEPLSKRQARVGALDPAEVLRVADDLLDVLAAAHAEGVIHRDIKPDNLFLLEDGRLKVLDFGIARMREGDAETMHTRAGSTLGTAAFMPPEQMMGTEIDERADLFAVGATMFRLLTGRYIHDARSDMDLLVKMASDPAPPLASVAPNVPNNICMIVDRALAFSRGDRYPDARSMQGDVRAVRAGKEPPYAEAKLASDGPPARPAPRSGSPSPLPGPPVPSSLSPSLSSVSASTISGPPSFSPVSSSSPTAFAATKISTASSPSSPSLPESGVASVMPLLAARSLKPKGDQGFDRRKIIAAAAALAVVLGLVIWLIARDGGGEAEEASESASEEASGAASAEPSSAATSKPAGKGKPKGKWRKPKGSGTAGSE